MLLSHSRQYEGTERSPEDLAWVLKLNLSPMMPVAYEGARPVASTITWPAHVCAGRVRCERGVNVIRPASLQCSDLIWEEPRGTAGLDRLWKERQKKRKKRKGQLATSSWSVSSSAGGREGGTFWDASVLRSFSLTEISRSELKVTSSKFSLIGPNWMRRNSQCTTHKWKLQHYTIPPPVGY